MRHPFSSFWALEVCVRIKALQAGIRTRNRTRRRPCLRLRPTYEYACSQILPHTVSRTLTLSHCHNADKMWSGLGAPCRCRTVAQSVNGTWFTAQVEFLITLPRGKVGQKLAVALMRINAYLGTSIWLDGDGYAAFASASTSGLFKTQSQLKSTESIGFLSSRADFPCLSRHPPVFVYLLFFVCSFFFSSKLAKFSAWTFSPQSPHKHTRNSICIHNSARRWQHVTQMSPKASLNARHQSRGQWRLFRSTPLLFPYRPSTPPFWSAPLPPPLLLPLSLPAMCTIELLHRVEQTFGHLVLDLVT